MHDFRKLVVWQKAHSLTLDVYVLTKNFPRDETHGLTGQLRRACASIGLNLAEGGGKRSGIDHANYVQRAIGSSCEVEYAVLLARDLGYINDAEHDPLQQRVVEIRKMLLALASHLPK
ncbi:MAG TPA: four helix bundle protein [Phycisphaerales bacterium]|nr:four helix bundle protein [Phycisphaerales bacterium]